MSSSSGLGSLPGVPKSDELSALTTGHSAGGAVASLLYAHMLAETVPVGAQHFDGALKSSLRHIWSSAYQSLTTEKT